MRFTSTFARLTGALTVLNICIGSLATLPSAVIFPLYIYPADDCSNWDPLLSAISDYTSLEYLVIINPNSGPGAASQPDPSYQTCVTQLRATGEASGGNVKLLGYVLTGYGTRPTANITSDIDTYAGWDAAYALDGIFFDEASTDSTVLSNYETYVSYAQTALGSNTYITLNPGTWDSSSSSADYFSIADLIVTFENTYDNFAVTAFPAGASTPTSKQAAIIHTGPTAAPIELVDDLTQTLVIGASFYSDYSAALAYENFPTDWVDYVDALVSSQT